MTHSQKLRLAHLAKKYKAEQVGDVAFFDHIIAHRGNHEKVRELAKELTRSELVLFTRYALCGDGYDMWGEKAVEALIY